MRDRVVMRGGEVVKVMRVLPQKCKLKVPGDIVYLLICFWECFWEALIRHGKGSVNWPMKEEPE